MKRKGAVSVGSRAFFKEVIDLSWKEYEMDPSCVADWLSWGGIVHPNILKGKDDTLLGILAYQPYALEEKTIKMPDFVNGWCMWIEHQHKPAWERHYLMICWNPFLSGDQTSYINGIGGKKVAIADSKQAFVDALNAVKQAMEEVTPCKLLEYQEILDVLEFSLAINDRHVDMPDVPLYLDALLSQDIDLDFSHSHLRIDGRKLFAVSFPGMIEDNQLAYLKNQLDDLYYRHVRRLLFFSKKRAEKEEQWYTANWCPGRTSVNKLLTDGILHYLKKETDKNGKEKYVTVNRSIGAYYMDVLFVPFEEEDYRDGRNWIAGMLDTMELPYIVENYHQKNVWWGSIPGMIRSNIVPPIIGFDSIDEVLAHKERGGRSNVQYKMVSSQ